MQAVPATAGDGIIKRKLQIVVAEKPVESRPRFAAPTAVAGYAVRLQTSGNRAGGFKRLLIEAGLFATLAIEALRTDRNKVAVGFAALHFQQPIQRFQAGGNHAIIRAGRTHQQQGLRQSRVSVSQNILEPFPIRPPDRLIHFEQSPAEGGSDFLRVAISGIGIEVFLNSEQGVCPGPRTAEFHCCGKRELEQVARQRPCSP